MSTRYEYCNSGDTTSHAIHSDTWVGQTFTIGTVGSNEAHNITSVKLLLYRIGSPGNVNIFIREVDGSDLPTGANKSSGSFNGNTLTTNTAGEWKEVSMTSFTLQPNIKYAVCINNSGANYSSDYLRVRGSWGTSQYAGGNGVASTNGGVNWANHSQPSDLMFEIWGEHTDVTVTPATLALALTQPAPSLAFDYTVSPAVLALALTLQAPTVTSIITVTPNTLALGLTQHAPSLALDYTVSPAALALALTQHAPSLAFDYTVSPAALALALTLHAPAIIIPSDVTVLPETFALALTQLSPEIITIFVEIPPFMQKDLIDPYSGGAWLWLCEIAVPGYDTQDLARNNEDVRHAGKDYKKWKLDIGKQSFAGDGSIPRVVLRAGQDPDHVIEDIVNASEGCHDGTVKLIRVNEKFLDYEVEALEANYGVLVADSDAEWIYFTLGIPNPLTQRIPLRISSSKICPWPIPGLFKGPRCQYTGDDPTCTGTLDDCYTKGNAHHWGAEIGLDPNVTRV